MSWDFRVILGSELGFYVRWDELYIPMLNKNTLGVKKVRGHSEAALQTGATKNFDIS